MRGEVVQGKHILARGKGRRIFGTAKVGERGQIVIPKEAREHFGIRPGDTLLILGSEEQWLIVTLPGVLDQVAREILGEEEERDEREDV